MYVLTPSHPHPSNIFTSVAIASEFFPPTLIPRKRATCGTSARPLRPAAIPPPPASHCIPRELCVKSLLLSSPCHLDTLSPRHLVIPPSSPPTAPGTTADTPRTPPAASLAPPPPPSPSGPS